MTERRTEGRKGVRPVTSCDLQDPGHAAWVPIVTYRTKYTHLGKAKGRDDVSASL